MHLGLASEMSSGAGEAGASVSSAPTVVDSSSVEYPRVHKSKFQFKSSKRKSTYDENCQSSPKRDGHRHRQHNHHHRSKRRRQPEPSECPAQHDDTYLPDTSSDQYLDSDTAFRESLFDAMADDEGAQFWEGVYGQPVPKIPPVKHGPTGELEAMTEDEYAAHIRAEMYKKTHQYLVEEKARRENARKERECLAEDTRREEAASEQFRRVVEMSLKRGKLRKERVQRASQWMEKWKAYESAWDKLGDREKTGVTKIPWPVWRGIEEDISKGEIETFFLNGPTSGKLDQADLLRTLKVERVRWHPDKMQQKLGGQGVDELKMRAITAVFQIIDRLWSELRSGKI